MGATAVTEAAHIKCRACGIEYGQERRHGVLWPPSRCGSCGSADVEVSARTDCVVDEERAIDELVDAFVEDGSFVRIRRTAEDDAIVERKVGTEWVPTDDATAARFYLRALLKRADALRKIEDAMDGLERA